MNTCKALVEAFGQAAGELGVSYDEMQVLKTKEEISTGWTVVLKSLFEMNHKNTLPKYGITVLNALVNTYLGIYETNPDKNEITNPIKNSEAYKELQSFCKSDDLKEIERLTSELGNIAGDPEKTYTSTEIIQYDSNKIRLNQREIKEIRSHVPTMKAKHATHHHNINEKMGNLNEFNLKYDAAYNGFKALAGRDITPAMRIEFERLLQAFLNYVKGTGVHTTYIGKLTEALTQWKAYYEECIKWANVLKGERTTRIGTIFKKFGISKRIGAKINSGE